MKAMITILELVTLLFAGYFTMVGIGLMFSWGFNWVLAVIMLAGFVALASAIYVEKDFEDIFESEG